MRRARRTRKKIDFVPNIDLDKWLASNEDALVDCPNQPGNLKLKKEACAKRYLSANDPRWANIGAEPFHVFVFKMNLVPCRNCEVGAQMAKDTRTKAA